MRMKQSLNLTRLNAQTSDFIVSTELLDSICFIFTAFEVNVLCVAGYGF